MNNKIYTPQIVYQNVLDYLANPYSNQISGFPELTGYWKTMEEVLSTIPTTNIEILYNILTEKFSTVEDVHRELITELNKRLKEYVIPKPGRKSDYEKKLRSKRASATSLSNNFFEDLSKIKTLAGLCLDKEIPSNNIEKIIKRIFDDELNSTIYTHEASRLSNCGFRLNLFYSFVKGSKHKELVNKYRKEIAISTLKFHNIDLESKTITDKIQKLPIYRKQVLQFKKEFEDMKKLCDDLEKRYDNAMRVYRDETNISISGLSLSEIIEKKELLNDTSN